MRKVYFDAAQANMCVSVFVSSAEAVPAGTTVYAMPVKHKNKEYQRFAEEYDIRFIFEDEVPKTDFYTIPLAEIFAVDSGGGYICSVGQKTDFESDAPICYIDSGKKCYLAASNGKEFLENAGHWKERLKPYHDIEFFDSREAAQKKYAFIESDALGRIL